MAANRELYDSLFSIWCKAFPSQKGQLKKAEIDNYWRENKSDATIIRQKISELKRKCDSSQQSIKHFFKGPTLTSPPVNTNKHNVVLDLTQSKSKKSPLDASQNSEKETSKKSKLEETRAQNKCKATIVSLSSRIDALQRAKESNIAMDSQIEELQQNKKLLNKEMKRLTTLEQTQQRQKKLRQNRKHKLQQLQDNEPEVYAQVVGAIKLHPQRGRPRLEEQQPLLLKTIVDIVSPEAGTDDRRRSELLRSCRTLDDLHEELSYQGFTLSRSGLYLRLLPKRSKGQEALKHVTTVPVRLAKASNDARGCHSDAHFCAASIKYLKDLAELFGTSTVFVLSQDDKARVPLAIPAATLQAPLLMNMDYKVRLPDHDFPVAEKHKLIPSVYAGIVFDTKGHLTYSGPTYIAIRSGKHDKSTAKSHGIDFERLMELSNFKSVTITSAETKKPIIIVFTDGGPDENPRYEGTVNQMVSHFKKYDLDALFVACHAPGQSAYNQVERRMAPLSRDLAGVILPHDHFGSHLNGKKTVNKDLELQNFNKAGETLADIWNGKVIDKYEVYAEYIPPSQQALPLVQLSESWIQQHVRQSQYMLQIIKCHDRSCCSSPVTNIKQVLRDGFLPGPVPFYQSENGLHVCSQDNIEKGSFQSLNTRLALFQLEPTNDSMPILPFDYYCPSLKGKLEKRICPICHVYFPSAKAVGSHTKHMHAKTWSSLESISETIELVVRQHCDSDIECNNDDIDVISDIQEFLACPFIDIVE